MIALEKTILRQLLESEAFAKRVVPFIKSRYFTSNESQTLFDTIQEFFTKFNTIPSIPAMDVLVDNRSGLNENQLKAIRAALVDVKAQYPLPDVQLQWLVQETEAFCQERALYCGLQDCIQIMDDPKANRHAVTDIMKEALAVSFDTHIGHDFFANADKRYDFYHLPIAKIPFDMDVFNTLTRGGVPRKTLNIIMAGTNVGKSLALCHMGAGWLRMSYNVLYVTCEMAEERIAERIDANMMDIPLDDVMSLPRATYLSKVAHLRATSTGRLIIKEYPTGTCHAGLVKTLIHDLRTRENFNPDIVIVDYLTICASSRVKLSHGGVNSYSYGKYIAEEFRGLAVEENVSLWTAAQFNRTGFVSADPGLEHVGESFGIAQTADFCGALVTNDDLEKLGQLQFIELKNRYAKKRSWVVHLVGVDTSRMKLYDLGLSANPASSTPTVVTPPPVPSGMTKRRRLSSLSSLQKEHEDTI